MARAIEIARGILQRIGAPITVGERDAVHLARERLETCFIRMRLAGEGEGHHGAAMKSIFESNDGGAPGISPGNFHGILDRFGAAADKQSFLGKVPGRQFVQALRQAHVAFIGRHLDTGMQEALRLLFDGLQYTGGAMADVDASDAAGEIDEAVPVNIFEHRAFRTPPVHRSRMRKAARDSRISPLPKRYRLRTWDRSFQLDRRHLSTTRSAVRSD